jgi:hypothetical protein
MIGLNGAHVHGEFSSADASALSESNSRFGLYGGGSTTAVTLAATDSVFVTSLTINNAAAVTVLFSIYDGANATPAAGEYIWHGEVAADSTVTIPLFPPHQCIVGTYPKVQAAAGQVYVQLGGFIVRA